MHQPEPPQDLGPCPSCGSADVNAIWYGMPSWDYKETWPSNVQVGGCSIMDTSPDRVCAQCGRFWIADEGDAADL